MTIARRRARFRCPHLRRGKVRDVYVVDDERLLLVATDRVSAFDVVMAKPMPYKGAVLTQITAWWLRQLERRRAAITCSRPTPTRSSRDVPALRRHRDDARRARDAVPAHRGLPDRVRRPRLPRPVRRGRSTAQHGTLAGEPLPAGLARERPLRPAALQPGHQGRDGPRREHHARARMRARSSAPTMAARARAAQPAASTSAAATIAAPRGIIIADTKFEFGRDRDGRRSR